MAKRPAHRTGKVADWEWELINRAAAIVTPHERAELVAELAYRLFIFKPPTTSTIRYWPAYLRQFLRFRALDWAAARRKLERRNLSIEALTAAAREHLPIELLCRLSRNEGDFGLAFQRVWDELPSDLRRIWTALAENRGNQVAAAKSLGLHRNTVRSRIRQIQQHLRRHEYG
jgi:DNA-directed RNA polymerase specialized sigma24 family protein